MGFGMRRITLLPLLALAVPVVASAQPDVRDHRAPPPGPERRDHRPNHGGVEIRKIEPNAGPVGSTFTIRGDLPPGTAIMIGTRKAMPTAAGDHTWTVVVPELRPGFMDLSVDVAGTVTKVGTFEVTASAAAAPPPPPGAPPPAPPPVGEHRHREWKIDRPVISGYWPQMGKPGQRVEIRGENFPADTQVMWGGAPVAGVTVGPGGHQITFPIPKGATTGMLTIHTGRGRDLPVGQIEMGAAVDPNAEWKKLEDERRHRAEQAWAERAKEIAKDKAAREAMFKKWQDEQAATREERRARALAEYQAKWDRAFLADPEVQAEMTLHAQRMADLERMRKLAEQVNDQKIGVRVEVLVTRENDRHDQRVVALKSTFQAK